MLTCYLSSVFSTSNLTSSHSQEGAGRKGTLTKATHWWVAVWDEHPALTRCALLWSNPCCRSRLLFQSISKDNSPELNNPSLLQEHYQEGLSPRLCHQWHDVLYSLQTLGLSCTKVLRRQSATNFYMTQRLPNDFLKSGLCHLFLSHESYQTPRSNFASEVETCNNVIYHRNSSFGRKIAPFLSSLHILFTCCLYHARTVTPVPSTTFQEAYTIVFHNTNISRKHTLNNRN